MEGCQCITSGTSALVLFDRKTPLVAFLNNGNKGSSNETDSVASLREYVLVSSYGCFLQFGSSSQIFAQDILQQKIFTGAGGGSAGVSCSNSNNGTGHMLCLEELTNPNGSTP